VASPCCASPPYSATAHDIAIYKPCAVIDRAYKEAYAKWIQIDVGNTPGQEWQSEAVRSLTGGDKLHPQ